MAATKTILLFLIFTLWTLEKVCAQQCGSCKTTPSVAAYDFDIQIPQPEDEEALQNWRQLFWLARHANAYLFQQNVGCVKFTQPVYQEDTRKTFLKDGIELLPLVEAPQL